MPIDLNDPADRRVATWLAAQPNPAAAVKKLILSAAAGKETANRLIDLVPIILQEMRALRAEVNQACANDQPDPSHELIFNELRALRADLSRVGPQGTNKIEPPPEDPESSRRLDTLFNR
jgi:hypothetical protein